MPKYKLLALDIDGTLITNDGLLTETTKQWVKRAAEAGITVALTTGRARQTADGIRTELGLAGPMVCVNGAEVWKEPENLLERHYLSDQERRELLALAVQHDAWYWGVTTDGILSKKKWPEDAFALDWMKFGISRTTPTALERIRDTIISWDLYQVTSSHPSNIEIGPKGKSKATGLTAICQELGVEMDEVMAIGDNLNDLHMIRSVGFGVAMGNGDAELKDAADAITASNEEDGVARAIQDFLLVGLT